jgi:hypothetical protein
MPDTQKLDVHVCNAFHATDEFIVMANVAGMRCTFYRPYDQPHRLCELVNGRRQRCYPSRYPYAEEAMRLAEVE